MRGFSLFASRRSLVILPADNAIRGQEQALIADVSVDCGYEREAQQRDGRLPDDPKACFAQTQLKTPPVVERAPAVLCRVRGFRGDVASWIRGVATLMIHSGLVVVTCALMSSPLSLSLWEESGGKPVAQHAALAVTRSADHATRTALTTHAARHSVT